MKRIRVLLLSLSMLPIASQSEENTVDIPETAQVKEQTITTTTKTKETIQVMNGRSSGEASRTYESICGICHLKDGYGAWSLGRRLGKEHALIHERDNLTPELIRLAVRKGILGMPPLSKVEVSDAELQDIINYLVIKPNRIKE